MKKALKSSYVTVLLSEPIYIDYRDDSIAMIKHGFYNSRLVLWHLRRPL